MNLENITRSKSHLFFAVIIVVIAIIVFFILISRFETENILDSNSLSQEDISGINKSVQEEMSDIFKPDELVVSQYRGDHNWALAIVNTTSPEEVDGGFVVMKNTNNGWQVAYGPATDYDPQELEDMGVPKALIEQIDEVSIPR